MFSNLKRALIFKLATLLCTMFHRSYRYRFYNMHYRTQAESVHKQKAFAIASWHQNCFAGILSHAGQNLALLVSRSFDGEIISRVAESIGLATIRGSSKKGGDEALNVLIEKTHDGLQSAITVDGPKGPIYEVKRGIIALSAATGAPIIPLCAIGKSYWTLHASWDKFRIPKPFSKVAVVYGKPMLVSKEDAEFRMDELKIQLADELRRLELEAHACHLKETGLQAHVSL